MSGPPLKGCEPHPAPDRDRDGSADETAAQPVARLSVSEIEPGRASGAGQPDRFSKLIPASFTRQ